MRLSALGLVLFPLIAAGWLTPVFFKTYRQRSGSMEKTIADGDRVVMRRWKEPKRGDMIVFDYPLQRNVVFMKRIVALPGETVQIRDKQLFINGRKADEIYAWHADAQIFPKDPRLPEPYRSRDQYGPAIVPANSFFVLGDNRDRSSDSRYWGTVPRDLVKGVVVLIVSKRGIFPPP